MTDNVEQKRIDTLISEKTKVNVYLVNGIKLNGVISEQDQKSLLLEASAPQLVYKHAISTISPALGNGSK